MTPVTIILFVVIVTVVLIDLYLKRKNKLATTKEIEKVVDKENPEKKKWWKNKVIIIISSVVLGAGLLYVINEINNELNIWKLFNTSTVENGLKISHFSTTNINQNRNTKGNEVFDSNENFLGKIVNGKREGYWKEYYDNNQLAIEGFYSNGYMDSICKHYWENGQLAHEGSYIEGDGKDTTGSLGMGISMSGMYGLHVFYFKTGVKAGEVEKRRTGFIDWDGNYLTTLFKRVYWRNGLMRYEGTTRQNQTWDETGKPQ
jgi:hypothetical protein